MIKPSHHYLAARALTMAVLFSIATAPPSSAAPDPKRQSLVNDPTDSYRVHDIRGFTIRISHRISADSPENADALREIDRQLARVLQRIPKAAHETLRATEIWLEKDNIGAAQYHPSVGWLKGHNYNPDIVGCVELPNVSTFLKRATNEPVLVLLHELSHAYHHKAHGFKYPAIDQAFERFMQDDAFKKTLRTNNAGHPHYGRSNVKEFFAEMTEAYYWTNDFFPFSRSELVAYDPELGRAIKAMWSTDLSKKPHASSTK